MGENNVSILIFCRIVVYRSKMKVLRGHGFRYSFLKKSYESKVLFERLRHFRQESKRKFRVIMSVVTMSFCFISSCTKILIGNIEIAFDPTSINRLNILQDTSSRFHTLRFTLVIS